MYYTDTEINLLELQSSIHVHLCQAGIIQSSQSAVKTNSKEMTNNNTATTSTNQLEWNDVKSYQKRLQSFHNEYSSSVISAGGSYSSCCFLPVELSPILCARFGWQKQQQNPKKIEDDNSCIFLSCQNTTKCSAVLCIKFHSKLTKPSKQKLTCMYRTMLATHHSNGCTFKYDALSWLGQQQKLNDRKEQEEKEGTFIVPPFLIPLSKEYEIFETTNCDIISEYVYSQSLELSNVLSSHHKDVDENTSIFLGGDGGNDNDDIIQRMVDVINTSSAAIDNNIISSIAIQERQQQQQHGIIKSTLIQINAHLNDTYATTTNTNRSGKKSHDIGNHDDNDEGLIGRMEQMKALRRQFNDFIGGSNSSSTEDSTDFVSLLSSSSSRSKINLGELILSIFGWRLHKMDNDEENDDTKKMHYIKCNLCLNCVPIMPTDDYRTAVNANETNNETNDSPSPPPVKRMKVSNDNSCGDATRNALYTFHVLNSHRYYCPHVAGFCEDKLEMNKNSNHINKKMEMGTSTPCWEIVWKCLVESSRSNGEKGSAGAGAGAKKHQSTTIDDRFNAIQRNIYSYAVLGSLGKLESE